MAIKAKKKENPTVAVGSRSGGTANEHGGTGGSFGASSGTSTELVPVNNSRSVSDIINRPTGTWQDTLKTGTAPTAVGSPIIQTTPKTQSSINSAGIVQPNNTNTANKGVSAGTGMGNDYMDQYLKALSSGGANDYYTLALEALAQQQMPTYQAGTYESKYGSQLDALLNEILASSYQGYDAESDPVYSAYTKQYLREADRTTEDVLGQYAALTGGMPSTAAVSAAAQAGNYYKGQLADKIPELEQNAYQRYLSELEGKRANLSDVMQLENLNYGLWSDAEDRRYNEYTTNYAAGQDYLNQLVTAAQLEQSQNSDYLDALYRAAGLQQSQNETAYNRAMQLISSGLMPSDADLAAAGIDSSTAQALMDIATAPGYDLETMKFALDVLTESNKYATTAPDWVYEVLGGGDNWGSGMVDNAVAKENGTDWNSNYGGTIEEMPMNYPNAVDYAYQNGVTDTSDLMTEEEWSRNKCGFASYDKYVTDYVAKKLESGKGKTVGSPRGHLIGH